MFVILFYNFIVYKYYLLYVFVDNLCYTIILRASSILLYSLKSNYFIVYILSFISGYITLYNNCPYILYMLRITDWVLVEETIL